MADPSAPARGRPAVCQEQETIDGSPTGPVLTCALPAGHHSQEHYDRAFALVWRSTRLTGQPDTPPAETPRGDGPWPD
jgi:hypothetical protein